MGAKFSPSLANIYMSWWEHLFIFCPSNPFGSSLVWYGRYIDDLLIVWGSGVAAVPDLGYYMNDNVLGLRFTLNHDTHNIYFLDLHLQGNGTNQVVESSTYRKELSKNTILSARSCHPPHTIRAIPIGELTRAKRNCSSIEGYTEERNKVCERLKDRDYPDWILKRAQDRVDHVDRSSLLNTVTNRKGNRSRVVFSTPYSTDYTNICKIIKKHLPVLTSDPVISEVLSDGLQCVARRATTLGNKLCPSLIQTTQTHQPSWLKHLGCYRCGHNICICCKFINVSRIFTSTNTGLIYNVKQYINCNTTFVVYLITCHTCNTQYVGSTMCKLKDRFRRHLSDVNSFQFAQISAVSQHCIEVHGRNVSTLSVQGIERVTRPDRGGDYVKKLRTCETFWMFLLNTYKPNGLNRKADLDLFY